MNNTILNSSFANQFNGIHTLTLEDLVKTKIKHTKRHIYVLA